MSSTGETAREIGPFRVEVPQADLDDLSRRLAATRRPSKELVADRSQGLQLAIQELTRHRATDHDWRACEARPNALPQFMTEIDGVDIHLIHVRSPHENALPLIMTHAWPGSVIELLEVVGPLTDPTAHGGRAEASPTSTRVTGTATSPPGKSRSSSARRSGRPSGRCVDRARRAACGSPTVVLVHGALDSAHVAGVLDEIPGGRGCRRSLAPRRGDHERRSGHNVPREAPDAFADAVLEFGGAT